MEQQTRHLRSKPSQSQFPLEKAQHTNARETNEKGKGKTHPTVIAQEITIRERQIIYSPLDFDSICWTRCLHAVPGQLVHLWRPRFPALFAPFPAQAVK